MHKTETTNFSLHIARTREMGILQRWMPVGRTVVIIAILLWISLCEANLREIANRKWTVANLPTGQFQSSRDLALSPPEILDLEAIELSHDEVLVQLESVTVEAFIRTMLQRHSFHFSLKPGDPVLAFGIGKVLRTGGGGAKAFKVGSNVMGYFPVANYVTVNVKASLLESVPRFLVVPPVVHLTLFGSAGLSAYAGLFRSAGSLPPRRGETVVISAAAGGVGICAAQMAKQTGARVVGIAGGPHKRNFLLEVVGVDEVVDYKETSNSLEDQLKKACPNGIDFFFDNVGGVILDNVLNQLNRGARVVICGAISLYDGGTAAGLKLEG